MSKLKKALEKAKEARMGAGYSGGVSEDTGTSAAPVPAGEIVKDLFNEVCPDYQQTKVHRVDFKRLQNRVVSTCHESEVADRIKMLRTQILHSMSDGGKNTLLITSANPGEGKTLTAVNLALSISHQVNHTVLLVDADLRKPSIHSLLGFHVEKGLSDYLKNGSVISDLLVNPGIEKLVILPGGKPVPNSAELLGAPAMGALVKEMKERYPDRFIIFDGSSLLSSADALVFSRFVDGILVVVEAERTSRKDFRRALELLKDKPVLGTILNKATH